MTLKQQFEEAIKQSREDNDNISDEREQSATACEEITKAKMGDFANWVFPKIRGKLPFVVGIEQKYLTWEMGEKTMPDLLELFLNKEG